MDGLGSPKKCETDDNYLPGLPSRAAALASPTWLAPSPPSSATTEPMRAVMPPISRPDDQCGLSSGLASPGGRPVR